MNILKAISFYVLIVVIGCMLSYFFGASGSAAATSGFICTAWLACMILVWSFAND